MAIINYLGSLNKILTNKESRILLLIIIKKWIYILFKIKFGGKPQRDI